MFLDACKEIVGRLVHDHNIPEPSLCPAISGALDLNWYQQGVYFTLEHGYEGRPSVAGYNFTKAHPSGDVADAFMCEGEYRVGDVPDLVALIATHWPGDRVLV